MATPSPPSGSGNEPLARGVVLQGRYLIERLIGGGGMGMVYLGRDQRLSNRPCAIKEMVDHFIDQAQRIEANEYFAREADTLAQLKHAAIPGISDRFDDRNRHYLVMEYVEGRNLEEELAAHGSPLPEALVIDTARQLCDVLAYLHGLNPPIIYRDMKPSNVMLTPRGRVVLIDFGIARLFKAARKGTMIGTLGFAPPEQYQGAVDPRSDIYSLGATLHYVVTGRDPEKFPPFSFPPVRQLKPEVSANLAGAIDAALAYDVAQRPATVEEFRDMLLYGRGLPAAGGVSPRSATADLTPTAVATPEFMDQTIVLTRPVSAARRALGLIIICLVLGGAAFGATYVYNDPPLQATLGVKGLIDNLPWKRQELLAKALAQPLAFKHLLLEPSTREGIALSEPATSFTNTQLTGARYLKWTATFGNGLAGLQGRSDKVVARFFNPAGVQIAQGDAQRFVGPAENDADFSGVVLMPDLSGGPMGQYKVNLYLASDHQLLAEQNFTVTQDVAAAEASAASAAAAASAEAAAAAAAKKNAERLAMIDERKRKPLELMTIRFYNSTGSGTLLSGPGTSFDISRVLFLDYRATFRNRLYGLTDNQYRVDATYIAPDGQTLGSVDDFKNVASDQKTVTFSGRVGNATGGAFPAGTYSVNFYLNGQYFGRKRFEVVASAGGSPGGSYSSGGGYAGGYGSAASMLTGPTLARGQINGLDGRNNVAIELRLRPQANGFLHGELVIHQSGYGATSIEGFVRGDHLQFQVPYGTQTIYFQGQTAGAGLNGTFQSTPSGDRGTWSARPN